MKSRILPAIVLLSLCSIGPTLAADAAHNHGQTHGANQVATLQLNAGKKWETDAPLRKAMGEIRNAMDGSLKAIHDDRLSPKGYAALAKKVEAAVADMVANCKLGTAADDQLHIVIADLLAGADQMKGKRERLDGAVRVIEALGNYAKYFDDPGFKPIAH